MVALAGSYTVAIFIYQSSVWGIAGAMRLRFPPPAWQVHAVITLYMVVVLRTPEGRAGYIAQTSGVVMYAVVGVMYLDPRGMGGELLIILAAALVYKYRLLDRRPAPVLTLVLAPWLAARIWQAFHGRFPGLAVLTFTSLLVPFGILFLWWLFEADLAIAQRLNDEMRREREQDYAFVEFGRNVAGIVQDLNNDRSVLLGLSQLCEMEVDEPLSPDRVKMLKLVSDRLGSRIDRIMAVTRASRETTPQPVDLNALLDGAIYVFESQREFAQVITFQRDFPPDAITITSVPSAVLSIIENLMSNSCHALAGEWADQDVPLGAATLHVSLRQAGDGARITIADNGPGLPPNVRCPDGNCFERPDFEIGRTTRRGGSGIGMLNARQAARRVGATVVMTSTPGTGVTSVIEISRTSAAQTKIVE